MSKKVLAAASCVEQKYFLEAEFSKLPEQIQEEIKVICVTLAEKLGCTFLMGFYEDGELYFETIKYETDINFDEIGAELEIKELRRKKKELLASLELWYRVFFTKEGAKEVELGIRN
ncbi:DUF6145 family protein [Chakrabartyella piscis]|uniref:DUF6145 family protein n=1 Tax=Chakrabartyella piscis TaxID=2918914 RepID=UPI0029584802|nr:DUF6145 family protein [Chakrabartyella piscis]